MKITTASSIKGNELGIVTGSYVASKPFYKDFFAGIRNFFGWEIKEYTDMIEKARQKALERMEQKAETLGATAVINVRFSTAQTERGSAELMAYGTAIKEGKYK